ncbi:MAG TPA: hypothetical protein VMM15_01055 [Bradyrhizobium sp.]|nr:hypothetical protein [Bradyrhizobium sp.]
MEIEAMTIKIWGCFIVAALAFAGSAVAAVEWCDCPASARLRFCELEKAEEARLIVVPRPAGQVAFGRGTLAPRPPQVVVLTPRCLATE